MDESSPDVKWLPDTITTAQTTPRHDTEASIVLYNNCPTYQTGKLDCFATEIGRKSSTYLCRLTDTLAPWNTGWRSHYAQRTLLPIPSWAHSLKNQRFYMTITVRNRVKPTSPSQFINQKMNHMRIFALTLTNASPKSHNRWRHWKSLPNTSARRDHAPDKEYTINQIGHADSRLRDSWYQWSWQ